MSRDNWERLLVAVMKREQYLELCRKESSSSSTCSMSSDFSEEILVNSESNISRSLVKISEVSHVSNSAASARSITQKLFSAWYGRRKAKEKNSVDLPDDVAIHLGRLKRFSLDELRVATKNFNDIIIEQARNKVYRGLLADGSTVAVKRFKYRGGGSNLETDFQNEVIINSITAHPNFLGYCIAPKERLLVFRLMVTVTTSPNLRGQLQEFSKEVLLKATNDFSEEFQIGCSDFGSVYHATLDDGRQVAIKRVQISVSSSDGFERDNNHQFSKELAFLSSLNHKNLVRLLGYCKDSNECLLLLEYMENGTLFNHLHCNRERSPFMSWPVRIKAALDAARGIEYLHDYAVPRAIHGDINSRNILLDARWTAKMADLGISLMGPQDDESCLPVRPAGTKGYLDPEYFRTNLFTAKSDVYSFGVVLLELLSGCKAIHRNEVGVPINVVDYVVPSIIRDMVHTVLDRRVPPPTPHEVEAVAYIGYLAADCVMLEGSDRPTMSEVVDSLERAFEACGYQNEMLCPY